MTEERDKYVQVCPYCGGSEVIVGFQDGYAAIVGVQNSLGGIALYHSVCRTYVKDPEKLLKRKDRRE